jgi:hypothetical protein
VSQYCNPEIDILTDEAGALSGEARDTRLQEAAQVVYDDVAYGPAALCPNTATPRSTS